MLPSSFAAPHSSSPRHRPGFTLVELLAVLALIVLLSALAGTVSQAIHRRAAVSRCRAELAQLAAAIEEYARHHGGCPQTAEPAGLLAALEGRRGSTGDPIDGSRRFIDNGAFHLSAASPPAPDSHLLDPWNQPYRYRHLAAGWEGDGFFLYSIGPDGRDHPPGDDGAVNPDHPDNRDNLYASGP